MENGRLQDYLLATAIGHDIKEHFTRVRVAVRFHRQCALVRGLHDRVATFGPIDGIHCVTNKNRFLLYAVKFICKKI